MKFDLLNPQSKARAGSITTDHGVIETPILCPWTVASVKGYIKGIERRYKSRYYSGKHLSFIFTPMEILEKAGGLHKFMNWDRNILTDSGGYQVYSLSANRKIKEEGEVQIAY
jgi:queuine tRNA-ribosyltransferase